MVKNVTIWTNPRNQPNGDCRLEVDVMDVQQRIHVRRVGLQMVAAKVMFCESGSNLVILTLPTYDITNPLWESILGLVEGGG